MKKTISVDKNKCIHCGLCLKDCLFQCLEFDEQNIPRYKNEGKDCIACQHCMAICPTGALSFGGKNPEDSSSVNFGNSKDLLSLIKSRRSIRLYKNQDISCNDIEKIKEMLLYSPTGCNVNCLHFSIIRTKEKMEKIIKKTYEKIMECKDETPFIKMCKDSFKNREDIIYRGATGMIAAAIDKNKATPGCETTDPIIALSFTDLYAQSLGLGTLWCDMALIAANMFPDVYSMLEIPDEYSLSYTLLLGVPNVKYQRTIQPEQRSINVLD